MCGREGRCSPTLESKQYLRPSGQLCLMPCVTAHQGSGVEVALPAFLEACGSHGNCSWQTRQKHQIQARLQMCKHSTHLDIQPLGWIPAETHAHRDSRFWGHCGVLKHKRLCALHAFVCVCIHPCLQTHSCVHTNSHEYLYNKHLYPHIFICS